MRVNKINKLDDIMLLYKNEKYIIFLFKFKTIFFMSRS